MLCERCGERESTIHEVQIKQGQARERHLCEQCASELGLGGAGGGGSVQELMGQLASGEAEVGGGESGGAGSRGAATARTCGACGISYSEFKQTGLLGCPSCYESFEDRLGPVIERAHEGGTHHVGKLPRRALEASRRRGGDGAEELVGGIEERAARARLIREQLGRAIEQEQYERAAQLRDELGRVGSVEGAEDAQDDQAHHDDQDDRGARDAGEGGEASRE